MSAAAVLAVAPPFDLLPKRVRTTLIAGFPGETEEEFQYLLDFLREAEIDRAGCFAYSPVEGAQANRLPGALPDEVREERRNRFMEVQAEISAEKLRAKGAKVVEMDLTRTDVSYAVTEAFRCGRIVLACATYDGFLFPPMENLLTHLKTKNFQGRTVGLMENGTWAPMAAKLMRAELDGMKNITVCDAVVTIRSAANAAAEAQMDVLADELLAK